jgi:Mg-chelatase subunit ChlD
MTVLFVFVASDRRVLEARAVSEYQLRQELVGIKGQLQRVVFIIDRSGSMREDNRWTAALETVGAWIRYLPARNIAVIVYDHEVSHFPERKKFIEVESSPDELKRVLTAIEVLKPRGYTHTLAAIRAAYEYPGVDTIVLFTDGKPSDAPPPEIEAFVKARTDEGVDVSINTVGLGKYYDQKETAIFLMRLAEITHGSYRAL